MMLITNDEHVFSELNTEPSDRQKCPLVDCSLLVPVLVPEVLVHICGVKNVLKLKISNNTQLFEIPFLIHSQVKPVIVFISRAVKVVEITYSPSGDS